MASPAEGAAANDLVPLEVVAERKRFGLRRQLLGEPLSERPAQRLRTPVGLIEIIREADRTIAHGEGVPDAVIELTGQPTIARLKQGIAASVDGSNVHIVRPHYGLRRRDRSLFVEGESLSWCTDYRRSRHFDIWRQLDGSVVYRQQGRLQLLDRTVTPAEASFAVALVASGVIETSSLVNFLTL